MKKSQSVVLTFLPFVAVTLIGCGESYAINRTCVDGNGTVVPPQSCEEMYRSNGYVGGHSPWWYYWYYGGNSQAVGGHFVPFAGGSYTAPAGSSFGSGSSVGTVTRGGFGSIGEGHGSSSSGHGGAGE